MDTRSESEHQPSREALIDISFCGSTPLLWKVSVMKRVRSVGVIGALVGSLARQPRAAGQTSGAPLIEFIQSTGLLGLMLRLNILTHIRFFSQLFRFTLVITDCVYEDNCQNGYFEKIFVCVFVCCNKSSDTVCDPTGTDDSGGAIRDRLNALDQAFHFPWSAMAVQLCTARAGFSHCPEERSFHSTDWPMPRDERLNTRFCVYRDLRNKGFYLTSAGKFGGDFLVYPGDPLRFHAHFIALCISMDEELPLCDILAIARLGSNVKKTVLICSPQNCSRSGKHESVEGDVVYSSLQWSSMV
uniref:tRNA-splicing endonuclease subunit SEN34 n=1 Tax=Cyprinus carpio TaxID=7962 RepID=A0A8C2IUA3_CYPCA